MASDQVIHLEDSNFEEETKSGYALIDFWAAWCGPCVSLAPLIDEIAGDMEGKLKVCKLDVDKNMESAARFGVRGIPYIVLLKDGKEIDSVTGFPRSCTGRTGKRFLKTSRAFCTKLVASADLRRNLLPRMAGSAELAHH